MTLSDRSTVDYESAVKVENTCSLEEIPGEFSCSLEEIYVSEEKRNSMPNRSRVDYKPVIKEEYTCSLEEIPVSEETTNPMSDRITVDYESAVNICSGDLKKIFILEICSS
jgi:hypothetical protein